MYKKNYILCGRLIGRITRLALPSVCLSVPLYVNLSLTGTELLNKKLKNQNWRRRYPGHEVSETPMLMKRSRVKVTRRENLRSSVVSCLHTASRSSVRCFGRRLHVGHGLKFLSVTQSVATPRQCLFQTCFRGGISPPEITNSPPPEIF